MKGTVVDIVKGIKPLPKLVGVGIVVDMTGEGVGGGTTPPPVSTLVGVQGFPGEIELVTSIVARRTNYRLGEVTLGGTI
jgi:hypothetical protein